MKNDSAVSLILGTLLIVILTAVLAAIAGAFLFGMIEMPSAHKSVYATAHQEDETIYVTYQGGPGEQDIADGGLTATVNDQPMTTPFSKTGKVAVGASARTAGTIGKDRVVVTAMYRDGRSVVVLDTRV